MFAINSWDLNEFIFLANRSEGFLLQREREREGEEERKRDFHIQNTIRIHSFMSSLRAYRVLRNIPAGNFSQTKFSHAFCICSRTQSRKHTHTQTALHTLAISARVTLRLCLSWGGRCKISKLYRNNFYDRQKVYHLPRYTLLFLSMCVLEYLYRCEYMCEV